jgi:excisionase family DNA binding protein
MTTAAHDLGLERSYYSISEVAELLGVSRVSIWRWISSGKLPVSRLGHRTVRVKREDLQQMLRPMRPTNRPDPAPLAHIHPNDTPEHFVLFYDADRFLVDGVVDFISPALRNGDPGLVVATLAHRLQIEHKLEAAGVDVTAALALGRYVALDAAETLAQFMRDGAPDAGLFNDTVCRVISRTDRHGHGMRIFGEMVALLVAQGNPDAAIRLEELWNQLQTKYPFSLLCGYRMEEMRGEALAAVLVDACAEHSSVVPAEGYSELDGSDARLRAIAQLQQKAASLEREVAERRLAEENLQRSLAAAQTARAEAEEALRVREEFLSIASHELRTPITVLAAQAQLSLRRLERNGQLEPERVAQALRTMGSQADKLSRLVNQLLDVSRLNGGKLQLDPAPTDLVALVDQLVTSTRSLTDRHSVSLTAPASLECEVDALRLEQVLTNLLDNAIKYSPDGGAIEVVLARTSASSVEVSVRDHGLGVPVEKRGRIFERFFQAHGSGHSGMGLGLYVSRHIVELHGGQIRAEFPDDGGTRVCVQLPIGDCAARGYAAAD